MLAKHLASRLAPLRLFTRAHGGQHHVGHFAARETGHHSEWARREWATRAFTVGIGGPVGSGKTALVLQLCRRLREHCSIGVVTNDIFTREVRSARHRQDASRAVAAPL